MASRILVFVFVVMTGFAGSAAALGAQGNGNAEPATLRAGDMVRIQVWRQPELSGDFLVTAEGTIAHPLLRSVRAAERSADELDRALRDFLGHYDTEPNFVVEIFFRIPVSGEVRAPSVYTFAPRTTVARAVAEAGGAAQRGALDRVVLRRGGRDIQIDLTAPEAQGAGPTLRSGDEIIVPRRRDLFREYIAPGAAVVGAIATILRLVIR